MRFGRQSLLQKCLLTAACVLVARVCLKKCLWTRFGGQSLLQKVLTEGSMRFGGQSLLQKDATFLKFGQDQCSPNACCASPIVSGVYGEEGGVWV